MTKAAFFLLVITIFFTSSCESVHYVKSELTGTAKPPGGTQEVIPVTRNYKVSPGVIRKAVLEVLDEQGYLYEENPSTIAVIKWMEYINSIRILTF